VGPFDAQCNVDRTAPLLVVESSPSTSRVDRKLKFKRYAELYVPHY
jgi:hypothetical protein